MTSLLPWEQTKTRVRVTIIGDLMLDEYLEGDVNRISPEAPVPVHLVKKRTLTAGGAANVARNVQLAGGQAIVCGVWGKDDAARELNSILIKEEIDTRQVLSDAERPTIKKTRITSRSQQLVRIDWEKNHPVSAKVEATLLANVTKTACDALVLSDYGKGGLTPSLVQSLVQWASARSLPVIIDPKGQDYSRYQGAYLVTPNLKEACEALGVDTVEPAPPSELARQLRDRFGLRNVLITLGPQGMYLLGEGASEGLHLPAVAREVFDVSGAGDTVVGVLALALAAKTDFPEAMRLANLAAGRVVEKWGTQPITRDELVETMNGGRAVNASTSKIRDAKELAIMLGAPGKRARRVVFTNGCFDILHAGHVTYLEKAKEIAPILVVGVNSDESVKRLKGKTRPIIPLKERMKLLAALSCIDYVVAFDEDTPLELIKTLNPNVLVKGADYQAHEIVGGDHVLKMGGRVETIELVPGLSTSTIVERIRTLD